MSDLSDWSDLSDKSSRKPCLSCHNMDSGQGKRVFFLIFI